MLYAPRSSWPQRRGFSVPEMLAVIAIIVIILSLLMPTLRTAREHARGAICASNLHQLGIAVRVYANDHTQYFPVGVDGSNGDWLWMAFLRKPAGGMDVFNCPSAPAYTHWKKTAHPGSPAHPAGWEKDERRLGSGRGSFFSYGMNVWGAPCCADAYGTGTYWKHPTLGERKITTVVAPGQFIVMGDSHWNVSSGGDVNWSAYIGMYALRQYPMEVHTGFANILRGDGHVSQNPRTDLVTTTADPNVLRPWHRDNVAHWPS
jgi:prepilin-type N-terminal cleavage/methylation domain-containing protein/prepilin-type processing-associated H-X9-DG protein